MMGKLGLGAKARGYVIAALACAACIATWAAVVRADEVMSRGAGIHREILEQRIQDQIRAPLYHVERDLATR